jgi:hypothetical protein
LEEDNGGGEEGPSSAGVGVAAPDPETYGVAYSREHRVVIELRRPLLTVNGDGVMLLTYATKSLSAPGHWVDREVGEVRME